MATDYSSTLNLPKTSFSMKAGLPTKEPLIQADWEAKGLYEKLMTQNADLPLFILHDGPPYANGNIHLGHALNKTLKDFIMRYRNMSGYCTPYIHGWDTHGLPIEKAMVKKQNVKRHELDPISFRRLCEEFARANVQTQMGQMKRLGVMGDWEHSYLTLLPQFEAEQVRIFGKMAEQGYIYKGMKPVYWCPADETALAEAEIEYSEDPCDSIFVKFAVTDDKGLFAPVAGALGKVYFVIWTTTTWTLPGNLAICVGPTFTYSMVACNGEYYIIATDLVEQVAAKAGLTDYTTVATFSGADLEGMVAAHPFMERPSYVIVGDHVTLESGTGCVHTAPGLGVDDFLVCKNYPQIGIVVPVDAKGRLNGEAGKYCGLRTDEAHAVIAADLEASGALLATERITHQYPHCWRCKSPIIFRATEQWFCSVDGFKDAALRAIKEVKWMPSWGEIRLENMVKDRSDWCISRQRNWGVPIPIFYCEECGEPLITPETVERVAALFEQEGAGAWLAHTPEEILGDLAVCAHCGCKSLRKEQDIMDVWFDSGSSYAYVLDHMPRHQFPCDLYLEGNDQYRGWFQSSLLTSVATRGCAPYKAVLTHGMIIDEERRKMSKSLGNGIDPLDVIKQFGADILRLWVASVDYTSDVKISNEILKQISEVYRKIRNTVRMLLANLGEPQTDFNPNTDMVALDALTELDKWAMARLNALCKEVTEAYESYEFHRIFYAINNFCTIDMSKLYIDIVKDRLYVEEKNAPVRRSTQTVLYHTLNSLVRMLAPILVHTTEEVWALMAHTDADKTDSVLLNRIPTANDAWAFAEVEARWNQLFTLRDEVMKSLEVARSEGVIGKSLEAKLVLTADAETYALLDSFRDDLATVFIVSAVELQQGDAPLTVSVAKADGEKCDRCWMHTQDGVHTEDGGYLCARCKQIVG